MMHLPFGNLRWRLFFLITLSFIPLFTLALYANSGANLIALGIASVLSLCGVWFGLNLFLFEKVEKLLAAVKKLAGGDLSVRIAEHPDGGELSQIALAFDQMAQALEGSEARGQKSEERCTMLISDRKRMAEERENLATIIEHAAEGVLLTTTDWLIEYANPAFERISGFSQSELIGENARTLAAGDKSNAFYREIRNTLIRKETWSGHITTRKKNGATFEAEATISPTRDRFGQISHHAVILRDVTHELLLEKQIRQAQKMEAIGTLAGGIAHDFNNILGAIIGYSGLALDKITEESPVHSDLKQVLRASYRARDLVKQILAFSRQTEHEHMPVQVAPIVKEALKLLRASLPSTIDLKTSISISNEGDLILGDPTQIHQIVMNLCANSAHAMREKGGVLEACLSDVDLDAEFLSRHPQAQPGRYLRLIVRDTGTGMKPDILERIFEPFFTTKSSSEGTGMGLSVVHGIVKSCKGLITVYSEPDKGTEFHIFLPVVCGNGKGRKSTFSRTPLPGGKERILLVDDEEDIVSVMQEKLHQMGYEVFARRSSLEALEDFRELSMKLNLVITDQTMPNLTGIALSKEIRKIRPDIPIILCTGFSDRSVSERARAIGIQELLMKPVIFRELAESIRRVLDN